MRISSFILTAFLSLLPVLSSAAHGPSRRHSSVAHRRRGDVSLRKRESGRATFYQTGLGACGIWNSPSDYIVALNSAEFGDGFPGPHCFKTITISYNGKTTQAQITDECPGCPPGGLDMSEGLFTYFADKSVGVFYMDWWYDDGDSNPAPAPTTTTHKPKPKPTTTWVDPSPWTSYDTYTTTTSKTESHTSFSSSTTSSTSSTTFSSSSTASYNSTTSVASSTSSSYAANPTGVPVISVISNIAGANQLVIALAKLVAQ